MDRYYIYIHSVNLARFINSLGFGHGAKNKTIPSWIFTLPREEKEAFIKGLMLSDGYIYKNTSFRYASASLELIKQLRLLLQTLNYRVGKLHKIKIRKDKLCVYRNLLKDTEYSYICFSKRRKWDIRKYPNQYKYQNFLIENDHFENVKVKHKKLIKIKPTLDLRVEGEHNFIADGIVVHNTGVQRSSATPFGANTTTSPVGKIIKGKTVFRKDLTKIVAAHNIPYVAQASLSHPIDLTNKAQKALNTKGPAFMNVLQPCTLGWKFSPCSTIKISQLAVKSNFWPLYEVEDGKYKLNYRNPKPIPITEFIKYQKRYKHLLKPRNKHILDKLQGHVNKEWEKLLELCK